MIELSMLLRKKRVSSVKSFEDYVRLLYHVILKSAARPSQERRAIACARAHTRKKVFRRVINRTRKLNLTTRFYYIIACVESRYVALSYACETKFLLINLF